MNLDEKVIKVSDWSQKYKLAIYALSGIGITFAAFKIYFVLEAILERINIAISLMKVC